MKPKVYLETTIPSYLTARPSRDLVTAAHQQITREWWDTRRHAFDLFVSQMVLDEAGAGDEEAACAPLGSPHASSTPESARGGGRTGAGVVWSTFPYRQAPRLMRSTLPSPSSTGWITS